jgi:5-hydroxyisourate hydrolase-like protein (transthyretin family)
MKRIAIVCCLLIMAGCEQGTTNNDTVPVTCAGFMSPVLSIHVLDSMSGTAISTALVTLYTTNGTGAQSTAVAWDSVRSSYVVDAQNLAEGVYSVTASEANYQSGVSMNNEFVVDATCGATNDWSITLYLCPTGTACL